MTTPVPASDPTPPPTQASMAPSSGHVTPSEATAIDRLTVTIHAQFKRVVLLSFASIGSVLLVALVSMLLVARNGEIADRLDRLSHRVEEQAAVQDRTLAVAEESKSAVEEAKAEVAASPRIEVAPPAKRGDKPTAVLVIPARPSKAATPATPSAAAVASSPPVPAASIPIPLTSATVVTTTGGASP